MGWRGHLTNAVLANCAPTRGPMDRVLSPSQALGIPRPYLPLPPSLLPSLLHFLPSNNSRHPGFLPTASLLSAVSSAGNNFFSMPSPHLLSPYISAGVLLRHEHRPEGRKCQVIQLRAGSGCGWTQGMQDTCTGILVSGAEREVARPRRASVA